MVRGRDWNSETLESSRKTKKKHPAFTLCVGLQLRCSNEAVPNNAPCRSLCAAHCCRFYDIIKVLQMKDFDVSMVSWSKSLS